MATAPVLSERPTHRTVVLLRKSEKLKLARLAAKQKISSAEVLRRLIQEGDAVFNDRGEEAVIEAPLKIISVAAREANESMERSIEKLDRLHGRTDVSRCGVSLTESFLSTARDLLMMSENIKRMDGRVDKLAEENRSLDRRLMRIELMVDLAKEHQPRRRSPKELS